MITTKYFKDVNVGWAQQPSVTETKIGGHAGTIGFVLVKVSFTYIYIYIL
jgi:hypothetical protein